MKSKDCITAFVCTNDTGTQNVPMAIIGTSKQPRCFAIRPFRSAVFPSEERMGRWCDLPSLVLRSFFAVHSKENIEKRSPLNGQLWISWKGSS